MSFQCDQS